MMEPSTEQRSAIPVRNDGSEPLRVVVEPWASEVRVPPGGKCEVVLIGQKRAPKHSVTVCPYGLLFCAEDGTDAYEIWQDGERIVW